MSELVLTDYVRNEGNEVKTTSRMVAEKFGKQHKHVLTTIRTLIQKVEGSDFRPSNYLDERGKSQIEYTMSRKGFMLLAMRFTGDEALKMQVAFADAFEQMEAFIRRSILSLDLESQKLRSIPVAEPVFKALTSVARQFGLEDNQALLYANKATRRETGVDFQSILQIEMKSPEQERAFTPTELGQRISLSAKKFNLELERAGLQQKRNDVWCATESGKPFSVLLDAGKKHSDGTPIQQLKWLESVMHFLKLQPETAA